MKNSRRMFILIEAALAVMLILVAVTMVRERNGKELDRIAVILQDSDASQWSAFKYGLRAAAEDQKTEVFIVSTEGRLSAEEERILLEREIENGADAVIVQPIPGDGTEEMLEKMEKKVPVMLVGCAASENGEASLLPVTAPDNYNMGAVLAEELLEDYGGKLDEKTIGFVSEMADSEAVQSREKGFRDTMQGKGCVIVWSVSGSGESEVSPGEQAAVDFVVALDDSSLVEAGKEAASNDLHGALVYGIGNSTEAVYYLDLGDVRCLVVPDEFNIGYQSLTEVAKSLDRSFYRMESKLISHTVLRREQLFLKENQELLFTMNQ
ncbi:MAG: substrate-binding domain-containing protein [Lachnospiraceae bacterium]|nr:substrate-binding domain-containing protein [Lachnospiraceae bacterium]